jgi:hypothetical protein
MSTVFPDAEALIVDWLRRDALISTRVAGRVYTSIPDTPTHPLIRVARVGGAPTGPQEDQPVIQVDCWADKGEQDQANDVAAAVVAAIAGFDGQQPTGEWVRAPHVLSGPFWSQDQTTAQARYVVQVGCWTYPLRTMPVVKTVIQTWDVEVI